VASVIANSTPERLNRATGVVGLATLASRALGYVRDMIMASLFGAGMAADAFLLAFSIPNLLRRLFAEGTLSIAFVPVYSTHLSRGGRAEADAMAASAFKALVLTLTLLSIAGMVLAPYLVRLVAFGWSDLPDKFTLCVTLTRTMFPYVIFIGLVSLCMGILNVLDHFAAPALSPALLNISMIAAVTGAWWLFDSPVAQVQWLAVGVVLGGALQFALQLPILARKQVPLFRSGPVWHPGLNQVLLLMGPVLFGAAVYQINSLVIRLFASVLPQGSVTYLYYADRLVQFPLGVFGIAAATAVLPLLSRQAALKEWDSLRHTFSYALRFVLFITLPAMIGLIVLREPIIQLLFQRGAFDAQATRLTAGALLFYGIGLWAFAAERIVLNTFYALQDTRTPVRIGIFVLGLNLILSVFMMRAWQHNGLALALSLSSSTNVLLLIWALRRRLGSLGWRRLALSAGKSLLCAAAMGLAVWMIRRWCHPPAQMSRLVLAAQLGVCIGAGIGVYGGLAWVFRLPELDGILQFFRKRTSFS
jgi:putative peptidoglycan lipid II flippase